MNSLLIQTRRVTTWSRPQHFQPPGKVRASSQPSHLSQLRFLTGTWEVHARMAPAPPSEQDLLPCWSGSLLLHRYSAYQPPVLPIEDPVLLVFLYIPDMGFACRGFSFAGPSTTAPPPPPPRSFLPPHTCTPNSQVRNCHSPPYSQ